MIHGYQDFKAVHDLMPGTGLPLRVDGICVFTNTGFGARLEEFEGNPGINPQMLTLSLTIDEPDPGTAVNEVLTPVPVHYEKNTDVEYKEVAFRVRGSDDEPPPSISVEEVR
jgi:hypothetical protein